MTPSLDPAGGSNQARLTQPLSSDFLLCRSGDRLCAWPLAYVKETMRPLPTQAMPDMPSFLLGVAIIREVATPVLCLGRLLGQADNAKPSRFVTLRLADRVAALACDEVLGVRTLATQVLVDIPLLAPALDSGAIAAIRILDAELMLVMQNARLVTSGMWDAIDATEPAT